MYNISYILNIPTRAPVEGSFNRTEKLDTAKRIFGRSRSDVAILRRSTLKINAVDELAKQQLKYRRLYPQRQAWTYSKKEKGEKTIISHNLELVGEKG